MKVQNLNIGSLDFSKLQSNKLNFNSSLFELKGPLVPNGFHMEKLKDEDKSVFSKHTYYQILYIKSGRVKVLIDFNEYSVEAPAVVLVTQNKILSILDSSEVEGFRVHFTSNFCHGEFNLILKLEVFYESLCPVIPLSVDLSSYLEGLFNRMFDSLGNETIHQAYYLQSLLQVQLLELSRLIRRNVSSIEMSGKVITKKFLLLVERSFKKYGSVSFYAKELNISTNYLSEVIKENLGKSAGRVIRDRIISECKELLTFTHLSISEIAYALNFRDPSYFARFFKKYTGHTPHDFRHFSNVHFHL